MTMREMRRDAFKIYYLRLKNGELPTKAVHAVFNFGFEMGRVKPEAPKVCGTCDGRGEIGGFVNAESGYQTDPCPDCTNN